MRVARHIEERGPGVLFRGGSQRLFEDGSQAEEFVLPPAEGMIVGESSANRTLQDFRDELIVICPESESNQSGS